MAFASVTGEGGRGGSEMRWTIVVRPQRGGAMVVKQLTSLIVPAFSRNLARRLGQQSGDDGDEGGALRDAAISFEWS